jgi:hypothetical protein
MIGSSNMTEQESSDSKTSISAAKRKKQGIGRPLKDYHDDKAGIPRRRIEA